MKTKILLSLCALVLLALPWQGLPGYTLLAAFVPLLALAERPGKAWPWVLGVFAIWSAASVWWVGNSAKFMYGSPMMGLGITLACVAVTTFVTFWPFMAYHYIGKRAPRALAYTALVAGWVGYEFVFLHGQITFPWIVLGNGFAHSVEAVQWYEYTGTLGGSAWVWICNITLYEALRARRGWLRPTLWAVVPLTVSLAMFFTYREEERPITVQVVQPNFDPYEKFEALTFDEQLAEMLKLSLQAPADVDHLVAPETAIDERIPEEEITRNKHVQQIRHVLARRYPGAAMTIGATTSRVYLTENEAPWTARHLQYPDHEYWFDIYNTAMRIDTTQQVDVYHKSKLVAGAEMIPYLRQFPFLKTLSMDLGGTGGQLGVDDERSVFTSQKGVSIGVPICWEAVFGEYTAGFAEKGAQALFVISNDAWWGRTAGHRQLFAFSRLRAIETRRAIARSANTGISGFIDQRGRVIARTAWDERTALAAPINLNDKTTFYTRFGDVTGRVCVLVFALSVLYYIAWRRKRKDLLV